MQSENTAELSAALAKAQAQMKAATFNKTNPHFKNRYADLAAVLDAIRKPLADNGLSVTQTTEIREGGFVLVTTLRHATGQWIASEYPLPVAAKPQELGSALTYARRYSLSAIACIAADDDDDAEGARQGGQTSSAPSPVKPKPVDPPVHPETGEVSPHAITAPDPMAWGGLFVAAIGTAKAEAEIEQWIADNAVGLDTLKDAAPKAYERVMDRVREKRQSFKRKAA
jgi:hypothetical protein